MAKTVGELYLSLGVDMSELDKDFALADKTVKDAISRLNSESNQIKLQTQIDLNNLEGAGDAIDKIKVRYEGVTRQIDVANQKIAIMKRNLEDTQKNNAPEAIQRGAQRQLLQQQLNLSKLQAEQRKLASLGGAGNESVSTFEKMAAAAKNAGGGVSGLTQSLGSISPKAAIAGAAIVAVIGVIGKLKDAMLEATSAQAKVFDFGDQLGLAQKEAGKLYGVSTLAAGADPDSVVTFLARLDKQLQSAGASGNETTKTLEKFGVTLTGEKGQLLNYNDQLKALAQGFQRAKAAGKLEEFYAGLGARAAGLRDLLNKYETYSDIVDSLGGKGVFDPKRAAEFDDEVAKLNMQFERLKQSVGAALIPIGQKIIPAAIAAVEELSEAMAEAYRRYTWTPQDDIDAREAEEAESRKKEAEAEAYQRDARRVAEMELQRDISEIRENANQSDLQKALKAIDKEVEEKKKKYAEIMTPEISGLIDAGGDEKKAKILKDFDSSTMSKLNDIWRTGLEQRLAVIDKEKEAWKQKGVDEVEATRWAEQAKIDAVVNRNRAVMTQEREALNAYLTGGIKGLEAYQVKKDNYIGQLDVNTLNAFDAAKKAVLQKMYGGGLEPTAGGGAMGGSGIDKLEAPVNQTAVYAKAQYDLMAHGIKTDIQSIPVADIQQGINGSNVAWNNPEIQNYLNDGQGVGGVGGGYADKGAGMEIIRGTKSYTVAANGLEYLTDKMDKTMEIIRGTESSYNKLGQAGGNNQMAAINQSLQGILSQMPVNRPPEVNINVNIENAVTEDSAGMTRLADAVAGRITPKVEAALGGSNNGY